MTLAIAAYAILALAAMGMTLREGRGRRPSWVLAGCLLCLLWLPTILAFVAWQRILALSAGRRDAPAPRALAASPLTPG